MWDAYYDGSIYDEPPIVDITFSWLIGVIDVYGC